MQRAVHFFSMTREQLRKVAYKLAQQSLMDAINDGQLYLFYGGQDAFCLMIEDKGRPPQSIINHATVEMLNTYMNKRPGGELLSVHDIQPDSTTPLQNSGVMTMMDDVPITMPRGHNGKAAPPPIPMMGFNPDDEDDDDSEGDAPARALT